MRPLVLVLAAAGGSTALCQESTFTTGLAISIPQQARTAIRRDPVEHQIVAGTWKTPLAGDMVGSRAWQKADAGKDGQFSGPETSSGYFFWNYSAESDGIYLLESRGSGMAYVNGVPRAGDVYGFGYGVVPVKLKKGANEILFSCGRGFLGAKIRPAGREVAALDVRDATTPDLLAGGKGQLWASVILRNSTDDWLEGAVLECVPAGKGKSITTKIPKIWPLAVTKAAFKLDGGAAGEAYKLRLKRKGQTIAEADLNLRRREPAQAHKITFVSEIDGSVQYYAVLPSTTPGSGQALFLSLHGASVEGIGQAEAYGAKSWGTIVAPTNRRPYGFNWEDIGRKDGMEVLKLASHDLKPDPSRIFVTGHSMGGHGTWQFASHFPDRFAGAAPAAGWVSYWSYAGGAKYDLTDPLQAELRRASNSSDTLEFVRNLKDLAVFVIHGDKDDNVPLSEAHTMRDALAPFHKDFNIHEEPGQGHWFDTDPEPGANCMDYRPAYEVFARRRIPSADEAFDIDFTTASPRINGHHFWAEVVTQEKPLAFSRLKLTRNPGQKMISGTTENVRRLKLEPIGIPAGATMQVNLDGSKVTAKVPGNGVLELTKSAGGWEIAKPATDEELAAQGTWTFKDVLDSRVVIIIGTSGTPEETEWAVRKARYDADQLWYVANGTALVIKDTEWTPEITKGRNVLLYGHSQMNAVWTKLMAGSEAVVARNTVQRGRMRETGSWAVLTSMPKPGEPQNLVGAICGTDRAGMERATRIPIFTAGVGLPPTLVLPAQPEAK